MSTNVTVVRNAAWIVAWDDANEQHVYLRDADVAFQGTEIVQVGGHYDGPAAQEIDGRARLILPGLINIHTHPSSEPLRKGLTDETRSPNFWHSSLYEFLPVFAGDREGAIAGIRVAMAELLMSGVTTVADLSIPFDGWLDTLAESGIRAVAAPMFRDARWRVAEGRRIEYDWDEQAGREAFAEAQRVIELARQHPSGRLSGMVCPAQIDTCTPDLIRDAHDYAKERNMPFQIHAAQSVNEFHEMIRRHGVTPIQWLKDIGGLGPHAIIGHAIFLDHHPWLHWTSRNDLAILRDTETTVAHCPTVFMRRGITLQSFGEYRRAGINLGIGTDTYPHNFLEEMRGAGNFARIAMGTVDDLETRDVFEAATTGGARALGRTDIGRLASGCKADFVLVDIKDPSMMPLREPLRSLIFVAADRAVRDVYVDGVCVVKEGRPLNIDLSAASDALEAAQQRSMERVPELDWAGRDAEALSPMVFQTVKQIP
ncbi:MAG: amidohydrolase family protein [Alphaproteobacteria bacterium]|nr:amidohydrolase family protein [Alphaproteobacteria bacterium]